MAVAWTAPSHYLNQCWNMVNETLRNIQWNINRNSYIFIKENGLENVVCEMTSILSRPQCVNRFLEKNPKKQAYVILGCRQFFVYRCYMGTLLPHVKRFYEYPIKLQYGTSPKRKHFLIYICFKCRYFGSCCCTQMDYVCICADGDWNPSLRMAARIKHRQM